jgi:crossover junction endodeoxyribonuclease RuvC
MLREPSIRSIGLDLSLTGTGVVVLEDGKILSQKLIKSKPCGDRPCNEVTRIRTIVSGIEEVVRSNKLDVAVIEGLAFMVRNATALVQLSALNYMTRAMLMDCGVPFVIVAPTSLKKFVTGNGGSKKDVMLIEVYKRWGETLLDDNICDAYSLARVGEAFIRPDEQIPAFQRDVLALLEKQK